MYVLLSGGLWHPPPQKKNKNRFSCDKAHIEANPKGRFSYILAQLLDSLIVSSFVCNSLILYVPVNKFSGMSGWVFLYWTSSKQELMCHAQGHSTVKLEPATPQSPVKQSTTEPLRTQILCNDTLVTNFHPFNQVTCSIPVVSMYMYFQWYNKKVWILIRWLQQCFQIKIKSKFSRTISPDS